MPPGYKGELPESGYFVCKLRTTRATALGRCFLENNDPKPVAAMIKKTLKVYPLLSRWLRHEHRLALEGETTLARTPDHKLDWAFLRPQEPVKFIEGTGKVMNTIPPNDFSYFEMINDVVQKEPADALDPEIMGSLAAIGIVKGKPFKPDARMKKILTDAAAIGTAAGRTAQLARAPIRGVHYYPNSAWMNMLFVGGYNFETPPPEVSADGKITSYPPTGARTLNSRTAMFFYATGITPAMIMRLTGIGSQYLGAFVDAKGEYFDGSKTYKVHAAAKTSRRRNSGPSPSTTTRPARCSTRRSVIRAPAARAIPRPPPRQTPMAPRPSTSARHKPDGVKRGNWIQTDPNKGWNTILRLYSPLEPFFTKKWRPSEIELVK